MRATTPVSSGPSNDSEEGVRVQPHPRHHPYNAAREASWLRAPCHTHSSIAAWEPHRSVPLRLDTVAPHRFGSDATATSRVSRETLGVPGPVCIWSPHVQDSARV